MNWSIGFILLVAVSVLGAISCQSEQVGIAKTEVGAQDTEQDIKSPTEKVESTLEEHIQKLIKDLGDNDFKTRESATTELAEIGTPAKRYLEEALKSKDPEVKLRAKKIFKEIPEATSPQTSPQKILVIVGWKTVEKQVLIDGVWETFSETMPIYEEVYKK
ncbi:MAG: hypothetical protein A2W23_03305 [Planctomycetes bacterium RBG_16_43_13]|nr:MAG: hypothetical protein A2W23_03305 [Planctomycetes bacterium RBG_16_43_13]